MKISLIVPTKNRLGTLKHCVDSCLSSKYHDLEIIISNNQSEDGTAEYLASLTDERLTVLTTPSPLSMRANFEFALDHASGEYIFYIGDDDGITPFGVEALSYFIRASGADAINWTTIPYIWPDTIYPGALSSLVLKSRNFSSSYQRLDQHAIFEKFLDGSVGSYMDGAKIYHGCVSRTLVNKVREKANGQYFGAMSPDVFVAIANLKFLDRFIETGCSVSISGKSAASNGWANIKTTGNRERAELFFKDAKESVIPDPRSLVDLKIRSLKVHELDALMLVNEQLFEGNLKIDYQRWIGLIAENINCFDDSEYTENVAKIHKLAEKLEVARPDVSAFVEQSEQGRNNSKEIIKNRPKHIRCFSRKLATVADAAIACRYDPQKIETGNIFSDIINWWKFQYDFNRRI